MSETTAEHNNRFEHEHGGAAEPTLRESDAILHSFYDSAPMMMGVVELLEDDILHLSGNAAAARFLNVPSLTARRRLASEIGTPREHIEEWIQHCKECARAQAPVRFEYAHRTSRDARWLTVVVSTIATTAEGRCRCSYIAEDITERKHAACLLREQSDALQESERLLRTLIDNFPNGAVVLFDRDLRFTVAGGRGFTEAGLTNDFLVGKTVWEAFDPEVAAVNDPRMRAALAGSASCAEISFGDHVYEVSILPVRNDDGEVVAGLTLTHDITARKHADDGRERLLALVEAERTRLRTVLEQMPAGVFMGEAPSGKLFFANREAQRIYGLSDPLSITVEEWTAWKAYRHDGTLILPHEYPLARAIATGETTQDEEYIIVREDGSRAALQVNAAPIRDEQGRTVAGVVAFYDITERMEHIKEIESLNVRLKRSIQETHHRVKNNLQIISALTELQIEEGSATVPTAALKRVGQHTRSLAALHDLLTQQAKTDLKMDTVSTRTALDRLVSLLLTTTGGRNIRSEVDDIELPVQDGTSLALLVSELVSNAVKHGRGEIELTFHVTGNTARLEVCDDGPGFPEGFDPAVAGNTGLSLIDSTGRYELEGTITYENRSEGGARVAIVFPMQLAPAS